MLSTKNLKIIITITIQGSFASTLTLAFSPPQSISRFFSLSLPPPPKKLLQLLSPLKNQFPPRFLSFPPFPLYYLSYSFALFLQTCPIPLLPRIVPNGFKIVRKYQLLKKINSTNATLFSGLPGLNLIPLPLVQH